MNGEFTIEEPTRIDEVLELLRSGDETVRVIGGGTGLALLMKYGFFEPTVLVSLRRLEPRLDRIQVLSGGELRLGAMATLRDLEDSAVVARHSPLLQDALNVLATIRLRNVAQLGGAIAHGHPQMDIPPVLLALDAKVRATSARQDRWIRAEDLFLGYYETAIGDDELVTDVVVPPFGVHRAAYRKVTARAVDDWPMLGIAAVAATNGDGNAVERLRVAVGALTDRAQRVPAVEEALIGGHPTAEVVRAAAESGADSLEYHDTAAASAAYQRHLVAVHLRRTLMAVLLPQGGSSS